MSVPAAITYLTLLRRHRGLSQTDVARIAGVTLRQVQHWENDFIEPRSGAMAGYTAAVAGNPLFVQCLLNNPALSFDDAETLFSIHLQLERYGL